MAKTLDRGLENREIVLDILTEMLEQGAFVHLVLSQAPQKYQYLGKADRSFITQTVGGALECLIQIDGVVNRCFKTKMYKMKPLIRSLLRMSVCRILYMDRVPDSVAYNETIGLVVKRHLSRLKGFVNGVLRTTSRGKEKLTPDTPPLRYSIPGWMYAMWEKEFGKEKAGRIATFFLKDKLTWARCNLYRADQERILASLKAQGALVRELPFMGSMIAIDGYGYLGGLDAFRKGQVQIRDMTSAFMGEITSPEKGSYIIDVHAVPGGRGLHLADKLRGTGMVEARDLTYQKAALIGENMARCGVTNMKTLAWDVLESDPPTTGKADIVIADLPCFGLGIIGGKPDIKYDITSEKLEELARLQREILSVVWRYVKPGDLLCYSTYTVGELENQDNATWLRGRFPLAPVDSTDRFGGLSQGSSLKEGWTQFLPGVHLYDGFFISVFRYAEDESDPDGIQSVSWRESLCQIYWTAMERKVQGP